MHECLDCFLKSTPDIHGNCPGCGSKAIFELAKYRAIAPNLTDMKGELMTRFDDLNDWKYEVENGDTVLGFKEWLAHKTESENKQISDGYIEQQQRMAQAIVPDWEGADYDN